MSSGIYYNQSVTAEILNGMAKDLGNTSFNGFTTNKFGADELNNITKSLVSSGVLLSGNSCEATASDSNVVVKSGTIVFENGAKIEITESKMFSKTANKVIYALNNVYEGTASIVIGDEYPKTGTDYVKIASIDTGGNVIDERKFAVAKVNLTANPSNMYTTKELYIEKIPNGSSEHECHVDDVIVNHSFKYIHLEYLDTTDYRTKAVGNSDEVRISLEPDDGPTVFADLIFRISGSTVRMYIDEGMVYSKVKVTFM